MIIYFSLVLISPVIMLLLRKNEEKERIALIVTCAFVFLLLALRSKDSGCDLNAYYSFFEYLKGVSFIEVLKDFRFLGRSNLVNTEWGYVLFSWIVAKFGLGFQSLLVIQSAFCVFSIYHFIDRYSERPSLSIVIIIAFGIVDYYYCILRQSIAFAILLFSVDAMQKRKYHIFALLVALATMFHRSVALFVIALPLSFLPINWYTSLGWIGLSALIFPAFPILYRLVLEKIMMKLQGSSYLYEGFEFGELVIVILAVAIFMTFYYTKKENVSTLDRSLFWTFMITVPLEFTSMFLPILGRLLTLVFLPFSSVAITISFLKKGKKPDRLEVVLEVLIFLAVCAYYAFCLYFDKRMLKLVPYRLFFIS